MSAPTTAEDLMEQLKAQSKALKAIKPKKPAHEGKPAKMLTVQEVRERLKVQRDELLRKVGMGIVFDSESREWARIGHEHRVMLMMLAGIDGDLQELATKAWREFTDAERKSIKVEVRMAKRTFSRVAALCGLV